MVGRRAAQGAVGEGCESERDRRQCDRASSSHAGYGAVRAVWSLGLTASLDSRAHGGAHALRFGCGAVHCCGGEGRARNRRNLMRAAGLGYFVGGGGVGGRGEGGGGEGSRGEGGGGEGGGEGGGKSGGGEAGRGSAAASGRHCRFGGHQTGHHCTRHRRRGLQCAAGGTRGARQTGGAAAQGC